MSWRGNLSELSKADVALRLRLSTVRRAWPFHELTPEERQSVKVRTLDQALVSFVIRADIDTRLISK